MTWAEKSETVSAGAAALHPSPAGRLATIHADVVRTREAALQGPAEDVPHAASAIDIETQRYMGLFGNTEGSLYQLAKDLSFPVTVQYTNLIVSRWFDMSIEERLAINSKNPDQVEETWFTIAFAGLLEDRGTANAAAGPVGVDDATPALTGIPPEPAITPPHIHIERESRKYRLLVSDPENPLQISTVEIDLQEAIKRIDAIVRKWFDLPIGDRLQKSGNPYNVPQDWFVGAWLRYGHVDMEAAGGGDK